MLCLVVVVEFSDLSPLCRIRVPPVLVVRILDRRPVLPLPDKSSTACRPDIFLLVRCLFQRRDIRSRWSGGDIRIWPCRILVSFQRGP